MPHPCKDERPQQIHLCVHCRWGGNLWGGPQPVGCGEINQIFALEVQLTLGILAHLLRMVMEPQYYAFRRWLDALIIIWEYDWIPRVMVNCWFGARYFGIKRLPLSNSLPFTTESEESKPPGSKPTTNHYLRRRLLTKIVPKFWMIQIAYLIQ